MRTCASSFMFGTTAAEQVDPSYVRRSAELIRSWNADGLNFKKLSGRMANLDGYLGWAMTMEGPKASVLKTFAKGQ